MLKKIALTVFGAAAVISMGFASSAEARHRHRHWHAPVYIVSHSGPSCGFYYWKWQETGNWHWKKKFHICRGWW